MDFKTLKSAIYFGIFCSFLTLSCTESDIVDATEFYEIGNVDDIFITVSSEFYVEGGDPISLNAFARDELNEVITNISVQYEVNGERIEGNTFVPDKTGVFRVNAVIPEIDIFSPTVVIFGIYEDGLADAQLLYGGPPFLTNNPWSLPQDFFLQIEAIVDGEPRFFRRKFNEVFMEGDIPLNFEVPINDAGIYSFYAKIGNTRSKVVDITVRQEPEIANIEMPVIVHNLGGAIDVRVNEVLIEVNEFLSNTHVSRLLRDNPNKVSTGISLFPVEFDPQGRKLDYIGLNSVIESAENLSSADLQTLAQDNYWNPNKYINIYITDRFLSPTIPVSLLGARLDGAETLEQEPNNPLFNPMFIWDRIWSPDQIAHEFGHFMTLHNINDLLCIGDGDFLLDTYAYTKEANPDAADMEYIIDRCDDIDIIESNVMSEIINVSWRQIFTYDQRERMLEVIEYGLFLPSPKNIIK